MSAVPAVADAALPTERALPTSTPCAAVWPRPHNLRSRNRSGNRP